jgi:hypothetical protein
MIGKKIVLLGAPRSGTTWLGKILDCHPRVLYRHEPDLSLIGRQLPVICDQVHTHDVAQARKFFGSVHEERSVKSSCSLPVFRKSCDSWARFYGRFASAHALKFISSVAPLRYTASLSMPAFLDPPADQLSHLVVKSVNSLGRANLLAEALPDAYFVLIVRNVFGEVESRLRGIRMHKMSAPTTSAKLLQLPLAAKYGLTLERFSSMTLIERLTWEWALLNEKVIADIGHLARTKIVRHSDFVASPVSSAQDLAEFIGLAWDPRMEAFITASVTYQGPTRYFQIMRDARVAEHQWREVLTQQQQEQIRGVIANTAMGKLWTEVRYDMAAD